MEVLSGAIFGALSLGVVWFMKEQTNKRIRGMEEGTEELPTPYQGGMGMYLLMAVIAGISALCGGLLVRYGASPVAMLKLTVCYFAVLAAAVIDYKLHIIPNMIPMILIGVRALIFVYELMAQGGSLMGIGRAVAGCLLMCGLLLLGNRLSGGGIGYGDVKLLTALSLVCGIFPAFIILVFALICCSLFAVAALLLKKMTLKMSVPFGPFLYAGFVMMCLFISY